LVLGAVDGFGVGVGVGEGAWLGPVVGLADGEGAVLVVAVGEGLGLGWLPVGWVGVEGPHAAASAAVRSVALAVSL
jgi:hypothetical protein